jgi:hypothetical protein
VREDAPDVACAVKYADDFDAIANWPVEDDMFPEAGDCGEAQTRKRGMIMLVDGTAARHASQSGKRRFRLS